MRSILANSAALLLSLAACGSPAAAQTSRHRWELFAEGGASYSNILRTSSVEAFPFGGSFTVITTSTTQSLRTTGRLFTGVRFYFTKRDAIEASYSYSPSDAIESGTIVEMNPNSTTTFSNFVPIRASFFSFNYVRSWNPWRRWSPFLTAGVGLVYWRYSSVSFASENFTTNIGGGVSYSLTKHWLLRAEYRNFISSKPNRGSPLNYNQVPSVGLVFRF